MSNSFTYTTTVLCNLEKALSLERLATYASLAKGRRECALHLYLWDARISESLQFPIHVLEITARNAIHEELSKPYGMHWYDNPEFPITSPLRNKIDDVRNRMVLDRKAVTASRIVSGLTMGFWIHLLSKHYETPLWRPYLHKAFPYSPRPTSRVKTRLLLDTIRIIRNRIAHHEPILSKQPQYVYKLILELTSWISPDTARWVEHHCRFDEVWSNRPDL